MWNKIVRKPVLFLRRSSLTFGSVRLCRSAPLIRIHVSPPPTISSLTLEQRSKPRRRYFPLKSFAKDLLISLCKRRAKGGQKLTILGRDAASTHPISSATLSKGGEENGRRQFATNLFPYADNGERQIGGGREGVAG